MRIILYLMLINWLKVKLPFPYHLVFLLCFHHFQLVQAAQPDPLSIPTGQDQSLRHPKCPLSFQRRKYLKALQSHRLQKVEVSTD